MSPVLDGPVGSNCVIQASSSLVKRTPILFFNSTYSPFYFRGATPSNPTARFHRAMLQ